MSESRAIPAQRLERARQVADAVLYEGYILYPYRPSSTKNRQRWTFGGLYPAAYSSALRGAEPSGTQTECLVRGDASTLVDVRLRFLHLCARQIMAPVPGIEGEELEKLRPVESLRAGGRRYSTWQEAVEREVVCAGLAPAELAGGTGPARTVVSFPASRAVEAIRDGSGAMAGMIVRQQEAIEGEIATSAEEVRSGLYKLNVRVTNLTPFDGNTETTRDEALLQAFISTHLILNVREGEFISLIDPPDRWVDVAAGCQNVGTYPVLVGDEGDHDLMLSSPIILYDYPEIAPESAGDLFDGTEIDEILSLRILTMTEEEKQEAREADPRACELLDRTESLPPEVLMRLHGTLRNVRPADQMEREG